MPILTRRALISLAPAAPLGGQAPPSAGMQFFGEVETGGQTRNLTVTLWDLPGAALFRRELALEVSA